MAFADFDVSFIISGTGFWVGDDDGQQQVNSSLSDPLLLQGDDARLYEMVGPQAAGQKRTTILTRNDPIVVGVPDTKAVSVRAWLRLAPETNTLETVCPMLCAKAGAIGGGNGTPHGYCLSFGRGTSHNTGAPLDVGLMFSTNGNIAEEYKTIWAGPADTWIQFRLDVIPVLNGASVDRDVVRAYRNSGTEASPVWTLMREEEILIGDPAWIPWGSPTVTRFGYGVQGQHWGQDPRHAYIDRFEVLLKNRP
jgi:hypothetical protein